MGKDFVPSESGQLLVGPVTRTGPATYLVVRGTPESLFYQAGRGNMPVAETNELGYGNNEKDWAIRMLTS